MIDGTEEKEPAEEDPPAAVVENRSARVVLDDSEYAIPDEWGLKEAYNADESVVNHGDTRMVRPWHV